MLKTLGAQVKSLKKPPCHSAFHDSGSYHGDDHSSYDGTIIDDGVEKGDLHHIYVVGAFMVAAAAIGLFAGIMGGKYGAKASAGFARNPASGQV